MTSKALVVIPARLASTRLPNKPLADICGKPMIVRVWERAMEANVGPVLVACGDEEILETLKAYGAEGILTDPSLPSGTDRVKVAVDFYDPQRKYELIVNIQGDLPTLDPALVAQTLEPFQNPAVDMATLATLIESPSEIKDPHTVKIALSLKEGDSIGRALYFSRNPLPSGEGPYYHHIGLYAYRRNCIERFVSLSVDPLEAQEKLEQLRALADGMRIDVKIVKAPDLFGVDTPADLERAIQVTNKLS